MIGEVTQRGLPHLPRVPQLHVNRPYKLGKKKLCTCRTLFSTFLCLCCRNVEFPSYAIYGENVVCTQKNVVGCVPFRFLFYCIFFTAAHLHLAGH